jgi:hypothetical protein
MKNYKLDTKLLPEVWTTWVTQTTGRIWMSPKGKRQNKPESWMLYDDELTFVGSPRWRRRYEEGGRIPFGIDWRTQKLNKVWVNAGSKLYYSYAKYHKDIDRLEIAAVQYDTSRGEYEHEWKFCGDRFFIGRDKSIVGLDGKPYKIYHIRGAEDGTALEKVMISTILRLNCNDHFVEEFKKFIGANHFAIGNGTHIVIQYPYHLGKWYFSVQKTRGTGKAQKKVDELIQMPLNSIEGLEYKYPPKLKTFYYNRDEYIKDVLHFERINDEWSVLRALIRTDNGVFDEGWRAYLNEDGSYRFASKSNNEWVPSSQPTTYWGTRSYFFANREEAIEKCNRIKYINAMIDDNNIRSFIHMLRFPCIEQLYKLGYTKDALDIAKTSQVKAEIRGIFGYFNEKEKNLLRQIGMTKYQLDKYLRAKNGTDGAYHFHSNYRKLIRRMRDTLGEDLSRIDNATFDKYFGALLGVGDSFHSDYYLDELEVDKDKFWKNLVRLYEKQKNAPHLIGDTMSTYRRLNNPRPAIDWIFEDYSDIVRAHDALVALKAEQDRERRALYDKEYAERLRKEDEKRKKVDEVRKHYEYEDENFIIRLPRDVNEIVDEGTTQSICIGGYTTRHSLGETNLFFLRQKSRPNVPFYAIEMNNNKQIVQIHGLCNRWLGNNPEAIPTVIRWLRRNGIKCHDNILTCMSTGYSSRPIYVEMPVVD